MAVASDSKEDFLSTIKGLLIEKGLEISDLQVSLKMEDVESFIRFIGKDWYTFGLNMEVDQAIMEHVKSDGGTKQGRKRKLLEYLIQNEKARYEDLVYGLYSKGDTTDTSINDILDYLKTQRQQSIYTVHM
jgi:hypothetical protein